MSDQAKTTTCPACGAALGDGCPRDQRAPRVGCYLLGGPKTTDLTGEQRQFLTLRTHKSISISGKGWDDLVRRGLIEDDMTRLVLTPAGRAVSDALTFPERANA